MGRSLRVSSLALLMSAVSLTWISSALASHTTFSAAVDRFEADGNAYGVADGVADLVDEFDDGTLAPNFEAFFGTSVESGGVLTLRDPGMDFSLVPGVTLDISNVESSVELDDGGGDFTISSTWQALPGLNTGIHFQIYGVGSVFESAGMALNNQDAANTPPGSPVGYTLTQQVTFIGGSGGTPQTDVVAIDPGDVTGQIVLRMVFDDATNVVTSSFSLDGGTIFQSPFPPLHVFQVVPDGEILLGANGIRSSTGSNSDCNATLLEPRGTLDVSRGAGAHRLSLRGTLVLPPSFPATFNPVFEGVRVVTDFLGQGNVLDINMPPGIPGSGCDPHDGWRAKGTSAYAYTNRSYVAPPSCSSLAAGLNTTRLKTSKLYSDRTMPFSLALRNANIGLSASAIHAVIDLGRDPQTADPRECAEVTLTCTPVGRKMRCQ